MFNIATKLIKYAATSGSSDSSYATYSGSRCEGAEFAAPGSSMLTSGSIHAVSSGKGQRINKSLLPLLTLWAVSAHSLCRVPYETIRARKASFAPTYFSHGLRMVPIAVGR